MITTALFDLDDTLIYTHKIFESYIAEISKYFSRESYTAEDINQIVLNRLSEQFEISGVNPDLLWQNVLNGLRKIIALNDKDREMFNNLKDKIYTHKPEVREGASELLIFLKSRNIKIGLVTHAESDWTDFKIKATQLYDYIDFVYNADVNRAKSSDDWSDVAELYKLSKSECIVIGDNVKGDIISSREAGYLQQIWIDTSKGWNIYKSGDLPENTHIVKDLLGVMKIIDELTY